MGRTTVVALTCLAFTLTGCGSDSENTGAEGKPSTSASKPADTGASTDPAPETPSDSGKTAEAARKTVEAYYADFLGENPGDACEVLTEEYAEEQVEASAVMGGKKATDCAGALEAGAPLAKQFGFTEDIISVTDAKVDGDRATVLSEMEGMFENTVFVLEWDGSKWLISGEGSAAEFTADTDKWLANWCKVKPGSTVEEASALMGEPTGDFVEGEGGQVEWSKDPYSFTAFLEGGRIRQLDTNDSQLSAADKAALTCESVRR